MNFFTWLLNLNTTQCWLLLGAEIFIMFAIMSVLAYITRDTLDAHFDRFITSYLTYFFVVIFPSIFLLIRAYFGLWVFFVFLIVICIFLSNVGTRYDRLRRVVYGSGETSVFSRFWRRRQLRMRRREALRTARAFISPYKGLFGKFVLSNKYCKIIFTSDKKGVKFFCISKEYNAKNQLPFFEAKSLKNTIWNDELFNSICLNFSYNTKLENIKNVFQKNEFLIDDTNYDVSKSQNQESNKSTAGANELKSDGNSVQQLLEQINVNEATEAELTSLPGISIIMAKKIIKQRENKGEYKSVNEFISFLKLKPHFERQIRKKVIVKPIKKQIFQKGERILDLDE